MSLSKDELDFDLLHMNLNFLCLTSYVINDSVTFGQAQHAHTLFFFTPERLYIMTKKTPEPDSTKPTLLNNDDLLTSIGLEHNAYHDPNDHFQKVFNLTLEAYDSTNYMKTIESSTWGIQELINKQIALLYYRAAAHAQIAKFEKGFEDAKTIIQLAPTQALGYLRVGELLSMYGNQSRAIKVYETGLAMANDHKELLEQRSEEASLQQQQYVDIIARAPFEILSSILSHFESNETFIMSTVSKTWQRRLSDIPECWSTVRMMNGLSHQFVPVQQHIVSLELSELKSNMCDKLLVQIMDGGFSKLRKLCINGICQILHDVLDLQILMSDRVRLSFPR